MGHTICLVSCVGKKKPYKTHAKDLYDSPWFIKARAYAEIIADTWLILSAEHGVVAPEKVIDPYEKTLNKMGVRDRRQWADKVLKALRGHIGTSDKVVILAGERYREFLLGELRSFSASIEIPLKGMRIGEQLQWLDQHV